MRNTYSVNTVTLIHNTFSSTLGRGTFVGVAGYTTQLTLTANLFAGAGTMASGVSAPRLVATGNVMTAIGNLPGSDNVSAPNFWPAASLLPQLQLASPPDATYTMDAPAPRTLRAITAGSRLVGALQSAP